MSETPDLTPTYVAYCNECGSFVGCSVADVNSPSMAHAVKDRAAWQRQGFRVETQTVQDVRDYPGSLGHVDTCSRKKRRKK